MVSSESNKIGIGEIFKYLFITAIVVLLVVGILVLVFYDKDKQDLPPECNDGLDNDYDNLTDYPADLNCSNPIDNSEKSYSNIWWFLGVLAIIIVVIVFFMKKFGKEEKVAIIKEIVPINRAIELTYSDLLKNKFDDIDCKIKIEKDGYVLYSPMEYGVITEQNRHIHHEYTTGEKYLILFFCVNQGAFANYYVTFTPLDKGEKEIKMGIPRVESGKWVENWNRKSKTFRMGSIQNEKARLKIMELEAISSGDNKSMHEAQALLSSLGGNSESSVFVDEDDNESRERIRLENMKNTKNKYDKKNKASNSSGAVSQLADSNSEVGDDE